MKVILLENVKRIGSIGEVIDVKRGFARNFLIANKKALYASKENINEVEKIKSDLAKKDNSKYKLTPSIVKTNDIDVTNKEAVMKDGKSIGYVTSGGFAHFINKSNAFSYLDTHQLNSGKGIQVEINGDLFNCSKINEPLYDPSGDKMRI